MDDEFSMKKSTDVYLGRRPTKDELMQIYVNYDADQPTQLTQEALRCCQNMQVDYRELLPYSKDS